MSFVQICLARTLCGFLFLGFSAFVSIIIVCCRCVGLLFHFYLVLIPSWCTGSLLRKLFSVLDCARWWPDIELPPDLLLSLSLDFSILIRFPLGDLFLFVIFRWGPPPLYLLIKLHWGQKLKKMGQNENLLPCNFYPPIFQTTFLVLLAQLFWFIKNLV